MQQDDQTTFVTNRLGGSHQYAISCNKSQQIKHFNGIVLQASGTCAQFQVDVVGSQCHKTKGHAQATFPVDSF